MSELRILLKRIELVFDNVAFVGDDIIDDALVRNVGFSFAPADVYEVAINAAHYVTLSKGGEGVSRESTELILKNSSLSLN